MQWVRIDSSSTVRAPNEGFASPQLPVLGLTSVNGGLEPIFTADGGLVGLTVAQMEF